MRRFLFTVLLLAATPAYARFCDGDPQGGSGAPAGEECTLTRVAHPDPRGVIVSDYSELEIGATHILDTLALDIDLSVLAGTGQHSVALLELGVAHHAQMIPNGGTLVLQARVDDPTEMHGPQLGWTWFAGSPGASTLDMPPTVRTVTVGAPVLVAPWANVYIGPNPDWCHPRVQVKNGGVPRIDKTAQIASDGDCVATILRAGVLSHDLEDGMAAAFHFHFSPSWLTALVPGS